MSGVRESQDRGGHQDTFPAAEHTPGKPVSGFKVKKQNKILRTKIKLWIFSSDTVGVCMKTDLPECFSPRERLFLVKSMVKDFKEIFTAMEELMGYQFNINVSGDIPSISFLFVVCQMFPQP